MEQWATVAAGRGYALTASVGAIRYADVADVLAAIAAGFRPEAAR